MNYIRLKAFLFGYNIFNFPNYWISIFIIFVEFLISLMYKNKNDKENAAKYEKLSREHLKQFDEMNKQKWVLHMM